MRCCSACEVMISVIFCLVFVMLSRLFIAALWSPEGKGLTYCLLFVMFIVILLLSHLVSWDRCGIWFYRFLILAVFLTFTINKWIIIIIIIIKVVSVHGPLPLLTRHGRTRRRASWYFMKRTWLAGRLRWTDNLGTSGVVSNQILLMKTDTFLWCKYYLFAYRENM